MFWPLCCCSPDMLFSDMASDQRKEDLGQNQTEAVVMSFRHNYINFIISPEL